ncbi:MaoC/PaaZ C-terminal domain-containing protein [Paracoccus sp. (in: a-proteobacteria)]|uniref:MaoC/PaaZ C-terminal domain-containing protein n=1 Tax=Paracoccus sp. TaxID=267 RepID=UPI002AFE831F|nr:MaoC/PaaZ C-terminal domain-containing protein [Paracoccus sp. (in: a-proteobacteria)]
MESSNLIKPLRGRSFEDFEVGQVMLCHGMTVTEESIIAFARQWDPQPFHINSDAARDSIFGKLVASGLHTMLLSYWLYFDSGVVKGTAIAGLGIEDLKFLGPLVPGDTISIRIRVMDKQASSRPGCGKVKLKIETFNQSDEMIFQMTIHALVAANGDA